MIPQTQSRVGSNGRCFNACLASILELKERQVPDFPDKGFRQAVDDFLAPFGLVYRRTSKSVAPFGYHTIEGISPRGGLHAVVGKDGKVVHDPHPQDGTGRGLVTVEYYGVLLPT